MYHIFQLKLISIEEVLSAIDRFRERQNEAKSHVAFECVDKPFSKLWVKPMCSKIEQALCEYCMIYAAKCELVLEVTKIVVSKWLRLFPDGKDSNLDLEVDKYVSLGGNTAQIYEIGYQLYEKVLLIIRVNWHNYSMTEI